MRIIGQIIVLQTVVYQLKLIKKLFKIQKKILLKMYFQIFFY